MILLVPERPKFERFYYQCRKQIFRVFGRIGVKHFEKMPGMLTISEAEEMKQLRLDRAIIRSSLHKIPIDINKLRGVVNRLVQGWRDGSREIWRAMAIVMICTGVRVTEALILSDFEESTPAEAPAVYDCADNKSALKFIRIGPLAKRATKVYSVRSVLWGLDADEIISVVQELRESLLEMYIREGRMFSTLDRNDEDDRQLALQFIPDKMSNDIKSVFASICDGDCEIRPRDLRGLYGVASYHLLNKSDCSAVVWIAQVFKHANANSAINYVKFSVK